MNLFDNPAFEGIDKNFLSKANNLLNGLSGKNPTEVIACFMAISNEAQKYNVQITPERQQAIFEQLRSSLPVNKRKQFDSVIAMMRNFS